MEYAVVKNKHLCLRLGFYPLHWSWVWDPKVGIVHCGPFCAWWFIGKYAEQVSRLS